MAGVFRAVTNIGRNPTFDAQKLTVESFFLDADENLYGRKLCLHFIDRIRGEVRFSSSDKLQGADSKGYCYCA